MGLYQHVICLLSAYLLGSIPTAVWIGKFFYKIDVREYGSGNAGATNTFRVLGKKAGIPVLIIDVLKGFFAVTLAAYSGYQAHTASYVNFQLVLGVAALIGHIFPVFAAFRGGKGIATLLGVVISIHPQAAMYAAIIFLIIFLLFNYVSLGSIIASASFPIMIIGVFKEKIPSLIIFSIGVAALVIITHQKNIKRLLKGEESKIHLWKKKNK